MARDITEAEVLDELRKWASQPWQTEREPGVITGREIGEALGVSERTCLRFVRRMVRDGRLEACRVGIVDLVGRRTPTWGYRIMGGE